MGNTSPGAVLPSLWWEGSSPALDWGHRDIELEVNTGIRSGVSAGHGIQVLEELQLTLGEEGRRYFSGKFKCERRTSC